MKTTPGSVRFSHRKSLSGVLVVILTVFISACASAPKKAELGITIEAAADVNPDLQGRPSPVILHLMELKSIEQFNGLDYMGITNASGAPLGSDLVSRNQIILSPGAAQSMPMVLDPATAYLGIVAGYRDIDNATWRVAVAINQNEHRSVTVRLSQSQLSATAQ
jgi:type VI secretion system protein VasD